MTRTTTRPSATVVATSSPTVTPPNSPAKLTAACPFLSVAELERGIGTAETGSLTASEQKPDHSDVSTQFTCNYDTGGENPYSLVVSAFTGPATVSSIVYAVPKDAANVRRISGFGTPAMVYLTSDKKFSVFASGKEAHGQTRTVIFVAPASVPEAGLSAVVRLVLGRL